MSLAQGRGFVAPDAPGGTMTPSKFAPLALAAALGAAATPAAAVTYVFEGVIESGFDTFGRFGATGADLTGKAITVSLSRANDPLGSAREDDGSTRSLVIGGEYTGYVGYASPFTRVRVTVDGQVLALGADWGLQQQTKGAYAEVSAGNAYLVTVPHTFGRFGVSAYFTGPWTGDPVPYLDSHDYRTLRGFDRDVDGITWYGVVTEESELLVADVVLDNRRSAIQLSAFKMSVTPEPGAWTLMILGFGLAGAALRGRLARGLRTA
jgi:hypothetical protein